MTKLQKDINKTRQMPSRKRSNIFSSNPYLPTLERERLEPQSVYLFIRALVHHLWQQIDKRINYFEYVVEEMRTKHRSKPKMQKASVKHG